MGFFDQWQYTNFHELDLDWILIKVKSYEDTFKEIKKEWQEIWDYLQTFPNDMYAFAAEFNNRINVIESKLQELGILYNSLNYVTPEEMLAEVQKLNESIATNIVTLKSDVAMLYSYIDSRWVWQKAYIDRQDSQLNEKIEGILVNPVQMVVSPYLYKKIESVQEGFEESRNILRFFALKAGEYDAQYWSADQYDKLGMSAVEYDIYGKFLYGRWPWQKPSAMCLTAAEYDSLELTAEEFDNFDMTVWQYDERSLWYLGNAPVGNYLKYSPNGVEY